MAEIIQLRGAMDRVHEQHAGLLHPDPSAPSRVRFENVGGKLTIGFPRHASPRDGAAVYALVKGAGIAMAGRTPHIGGHRQPAEALSDWSLLLTPLAVAVVAKVPGACVDLTPLEESVTGWSACGFASADPAAVREMARRAVLASSPVGEDGVDFERMTRMMFKVFRSFGIEDAVFEDLDIRAALA